MQPPVRAAITQADVFQLAGVPTASVTLVNGQWVKLGELISPAGLYRSIGFGSSGAQSDATGRIYCKLNTAGAVEVTGRLRISIFTPQDRNMVTLGEWHSSALDQNPTNRSLQLPSPEMMQGIGKDFKFVFEFKADASAAAVTVANSVIVIDTTEQLMN